MKLILFDDLSWENLRPLTFTRPVSALRVGILTLAEKWEMELGLNSSPLTREYLSSKFPCEKSDENLFINSSFLPGPELVNAVRALKPEASLCYQDELVAIRTGDIPLDPLDTEEISRCASSFGGELQRIDFPWKIFQLNGQEIEADFKRLCLGKESAALSPGIRVDHPEHVFVEPGFKGDNFIINASGGPVYLGKDSEIMEGSVLRGPFALCEGSVVKMMAKIYGPTTIGPWSKVGGEINNSVIQANSNKAHDGFLGNAVLGEWCNLGADTNNSNLKNNYAEVRIWNYTRENYIPTGTQFCGLIMGDHSKSGINTMFNTGSVVGVSANIFGPGFPRNFIPSFSWGGATGFTDYKTHKALETINLVMARRDQKLSPEDQDILNSVFEYSARFRTWNLT